ncbi:MAG: Zn-dependent oligopeptidase [Myxococcales bacterium]|nr:Zn-dependent oligopeptidase [Myxococcales bacterium]
MRTVLSTPALIVLCLTAVMLTACGGGAKSVVKQPTKDKAVKATPKATVTTAVSGEAGALDRRCSDSLTAAKGHREAIVTLPKKDDTAHRDQVLALFNKMQTALANAEAESSLWRSVHPDGAVRKVAEKCEQRIAALSTQLSLDRQLFDVFSGLNLKGADTLVTRLVTKTLRDFKRAGVDKDEATRARIKKLNDEIVKVGQSFSKTIIQDKRHIMVDEKALDGLPADWIAAHKASKNNSGGKIQVTTDYPDYIPFMTYSNDDAARKALYLTYRQRGTPKNTANLQRLLELRYELATLLGYKSWAAFITEDKMIGSADNAQKFIERIRKIADKRMKRERGLLLGELHRTDKKAKVVSDWQQAWLLGRLKKRTFDFDAQKLRPYLHYNKVKQGLLDLTSDLFGLTYKPNTTAKTWHRDVSVYDVYEGEKLLGTIYLDMHPRDNKYKHAAQFTLTNGLTGVQKPAGVLVCNFPNPRTGKGLMEHKQVQTFFHEFGHLMHHVLGGQQKWMRFSGVATEWDFVEAPSQIFEEWATDYATLARFATDSAGKTIPKPLVDKMRKAKEFGKGLWVRHQMFYASVSLGFHSRNPKDLDHDKLVAEMMTALSPYPFVAGTHMQNSFGHLNGYSAIYYTYMWSLVIAKDLFSKFEKAGILDRATAMAYRNAVLKPGGTKDAAKLVEDFLGRPYSFAAFEAWLNKD